MNSRTIERQMDLLLAKWQPSSHAELVERVRGMDASEWESLEATMASPAPASKAELSLRGGFYVMALLMRLAGTRQESREAILATIDRLYPNEQTTRW